MVYTETHRGVNGKPVVYRRCNAAILVVKFQYVYSARRAVGFEKRNQFACWVSADLKHEYSRTLLPSHFSPNDVYAVSMGSGA